MRAWLSALGCCLPTLLLLGCGGPSFDGSVYRGSQVAFRVGETPTDWRKIDADGALLAFRDDAGRATVAVNGRCGLDGDDVPLAALTHHLFLNFTQRNVIEQKTIVLDGREALRSELTAKLDGVPKRFVVYVLKKDGCVYDFLWIGSLDAPPASEQAFQRFVLGFSTNV